MFVADNFHADLTMRDPPTRRDKVCSLSDLRIHFWRVSQFFINHSGVCGGGGERQNNRDPSTAGCPLAATIRGEHLVGVSGSIGGVSRVVPRVEFAVVDERGLQAGL